MNSFTIIDQPDRRTIALIALKTRLKLEIKVPLFAEGSTGRETMRAAKGWGFKQRTRVQVLAAIEQELDEIFDRKNVTD